MTDPPGPQDEAALHPELTDEGRARIREEQRAVRQRADRRAQGLVIVNTGDGKGKTTAALGILTRAWGRGCASACCSSSRSATRISARSRPPARWMSR